MVERDGREMISAQKIRQVEYEYLPLRNGRYTLKEMNGHRTWQSHIMPQRPHETEILVKKQTIENSLFGIIPTWIDISEKAPPTKEVYEMPTGLRAERVIANVEKAPAGFVRAIEPDSFDLNMKLIKEEDVYYIFSLWDIKFLAKREGNLVRVFEAYESTDGKIIALPRYEVEIK